MDSNYFIENLKNVEKLNKTNPINYNYRINFIHYIKNNSYSTKELLEHLSFKSSCVPFILNMFLDDEDLFTFIENINNLILLTNINIDYLLNYLINILAIKRLRYIFLKTIKDKCLFSDTLFKKLFCIEYEKLNKYNTQNYIIIDSIFLKIFSTKKGATMFLDTIKYNKTYNYNNYTNNYLYSKDVFYKFLTISLIETFNNKHGFYIKVIDKHQEKFTLFSLLTNLITKTYINLIYEYNQLTNQHYNANTHEKEIQNIRIKNLNKILNDSDYVPYLDNFLEITIIWLNNFNNDNENVSQEFIDICLNNIYKFTLYNFDSKPTNKYTLLFFEKIFKMKLTKNYNIIIDYIYLLKNYIHYKVSRRKYKYFDYYINKNIMVIIDCFNSIYSKVSDIPNEQFELTIKICEIINLTLFLTSNYRNIFNVKYNKNPQHLKKFVCLLLENIIICLDYIDYYFIQNISNTSNIFITNSNYYYSALNLLLITLTNFCKYYRQIVFSDELKSLFGTVLKNIIEKNDIIKIDNSEIKYNQTEVYFKIKNILMLTKNYSKVIKDIDFSNMKKNLLCASKIEVSELVFINKIIFNNTIDTLNYKNIVHPDKYCDPITNNLIDTPIMLPNNVIVDKSMICRYLLTNKMNPYNREYLTRKLLDEFNRRYEIRKQIVSFENELNEYKMNNNYK